MAINSSAHSRASVVVFGFEGPTFHRSMSTGDSLRGNRPTMRKCGDPSSFILHACRDPRYVRPIGRRPPVCYIFPVSPRRACFGRKLGAPGAPSRDPPSVFSVYFQYLTNLFGAVCARQVVKGENPHRHCSPLYALGNSNLYLYESTRKRLGCWACYTSDEIRDSNRRNPAE